jgi:hypothetical protein
MGNRELTINKSKENLYHRDYYLWLETTAKVLTDGRWNELDVDNLIEEIESMERSEKRAIESNLVVLLLHLLTYLLKWRFYQPSMQTGSWKGSILEHRRRLQKDLKASPSLNNYLQEVFAECYEDARQQAAAETNLPIEAFPIASPFTPDEALNKNYFAESEEE